MTMTREEAIKRLNALCGKFLFDEYDNPVNFEQYEKAIHMAIEALSKPNYETDTEVRLAVTERHKDKVVLWDAFGQVEYYPSGAMAKGGEDECV